jgi:hypothetical protein
MVQTMLPETSIATIDKGAVLTAPGRGLVPVRAAPGLAPEERRVSLEYPEGMTVAEIVAAALPGAAEADLTHARVTLVAKCSMAVIERGLWHRVRPHAGTSVVIRIVPGDDKLRSILSLVVVIASIAITTFLAGPLAGAAGISLAASRALLSIGTLFLGTLAINALVPPPSTTRRRRSRTTQSPDGAMNCGRTA